MSQRLQTIHTAGSQGVLLNRQYSYSAAGDIRTITDGRNNVTQTYTYDRLHRLVSGHSTGGGAITPMTLEYTYEDMGDAFPCTLRKASRSIPKVIAWTMTPTAT